MQDRIEEIICNYTFEHQLEIFIEECAEAIQAAQKLKRADTNGKEAFEHLCEEVADVIVMSAQMQRYIGTSKIDDIISSKLDRQIERIRRERDD